MYCFQLVGINRKTGLKETIFVNDKSRESAVRQAQTFADDVIFVKKHELGKDWKND